MVKTKSTQMLILELETTLDVIEKLKLEIISLKDATENVNDVGADVMNILNGIRRDLLMAIENMNRIRRLLKINGWV